MSENILVTPGPVMIPSEVLSELSRPVIHHRTPAFEAMFKNVLRRLKLVFQTSQPCMILTSTGTGAMEAALVNLLSPGDQVIALCAGKFSERWADMAEAFGAKVHRVSKNWGEAFTSADLEPVLKQLPHAKLVLTQACETSTGTLHDIASLSRLTRGSSTLLLVDAVTALGALPLPMDEWALDVVLGGSQKAFMLPTGLSFIAFSERAWAAQKNATCPKYYFDLRKEKDANSKLQTRFSSPVTLIFALAKILETIEEKHLKWLIDSVEQRAFSFRAACDSFGFEYLPQKPSPSLTVLKVPVDIDGKRWRKILEDDYGVIVMGGQDKLEGKILRIGHMGDIRFEHNFKIIEALYLSLCSLRTNPPSDEILKSALSACLAAWSGPSANSSENLR